MLGNMAYSRRRTQVRADARQAAKDVRDRVRLAELLAGGAPHHPIPVVSASLVEPVARSLPCAVCGAEVRVDDHAAKTVGGAPLRLARVTCAMCGYERTVYFSIVPPLAN
jgi:hypothetical protein